MKERRIFTRKSEEHEEYLMVKWRGEIEAVLRGEKTAADLAREISELQAGLEEDLIRDPLTGAYNLAFFGAALPKLMAIEAEHHHHIGLWLFDLDDFKKVNDEEPDHHSAGNRVLIALVEILQGILRQKGGVVARLHGEEFAAFIPHADQLELVTLAVKISEAVSADLATKAWLVRPKVTVSIGAYLIGPDEYSQAMKGADLALYEAKKGGKDRVVLLEKLVKDPTKMIFKEVYSGQSAP